MGFLFAYCILRSVPLKLGGVIAMLLSILILATLPLLPSTQAKSLSFYGPTKFLFWCLVACFCLLTVGGSWPVSLPYSFLCSFCSGFYFLLFLLIHVSKLAWDIIIWG